ncbi:MAG TPA: phosphate ABC transporter permease PstA [Nitriliruptorales bacterium]|nr:phosphate ABC transporter permease PstA [Nitriliruptorales bacterium]
MSLSTPARSAAHAVAILRRPRGRTAKERAFQSVLFLATIVGVVVLGALLVEVLRDGAGRLEWRFLTNYTSRFADRTGILAGLTGTLSLMAITALLSFPIGVGAAIYLEEFAPDNRFTRLMQVNIANLAGVPSVVYGLLAAGIFVYLLGFGGALISGAMALTLLILPVLIVAAREAIRAVPSSIREAGLALGATPWQVTSRQVMPVAMPGILTGTILALSRAIGEAAPILVAGAVFSRRATSEPWRILEAFAALPVQIFDFARRPQQAFQVEVAAAAILVLLGALLVMNTVAIVLRNRYMGRW